MLERGLWVWAMRLQQSLMMPRQGSGTPLDDTVAGRKTLWCQ